MRGYVVGIGGQKGGWRWARRERVVVVNRTMGAASVVPELVYEDVGKAVDWLCDAFGFTEMWRAGNHRARIRFGNGIVVVADAEDVHGRRPRRASVDLLPVDCGRCSRGLGWHLQEVVKVPPIASQVAVEERGLDHYQRIRPLAPAPQSV
jgi:hypothetical protein